MDLAVKALTLLGLFVVAWALTHKLLPFAVVRAGRALGFRMKLTPLTAKRVNRFKSIKRGYACYVLVTTVFVLSLGLELMVNHKALYIRWGDKVQYPAVAQWMNFLLPFKDRGDEAKRGDFGMVGDAEVAYRDFARWVDNPQQLEKDALAIEAGMAADEGRFRALLANDAQRRGQEYDDTTPLPDAKLAAYADDQARANALRELIPDFEGGKASIMLPLFPYSPLEQLLDLEGMPPHQPFEANLPPFGTDFGGRDVLSQLCYGFRVGLSFAAAVAFLGYALGIALGAIMGFFGGWIDIGVQRMIEVWSSIPFLFTIMILASLIDLTFWKMTGLLIALTGWIGITYTVRGEFYREKARDYVQAATAIGVSTPTIMAKHILPNGLVPVVTFLPFAIVGHINTLVALDFLGYGLPPDVPSWGRLLHQGATNITNYPHLVVFPVAAFATTLFCVVLIGEAVREAFDPKKYARLR